MLADLEMVAIDVHRIGFTIHQLYVIITTSTFGRVLDDQILTTFGLLINSILGHLPNPPQAPPIAWHR